MTTFVIDAQVAIDRGEIDERSGLKVLDDIRGLHIRLLGDRSLQDHAWRIAATFVETVFPADILQP